MGLFKTDVQAREDPEPHEQQDRHGELEHDAGQEGGNADLLGGPEGSQPGADVPGQRQRDDQAGDDDGDLGEVVWSEHVPGGPLGGVAEGFDPGERVQHFLDQRLVLVHSVRPCLKSVGIPRGPPLPGMVSIS